MVIYLLRRFAFTLLTLLLASILIFVITRLLPGDIARIILGREASDVALARLRGELGLDRPAVVQYLSWLGDFLRGDWGTSYSVGDPIRPLVLERLGSSLRLALVTLVIAIPTSIGLGILAGLRAGRLIDTTISIGTLAVVGLPEFVTGLILIDIFAFRLRLLPATSSIRPEADFIETLPFLILPALTATLVLLAYVARLTRAGVIEELRRGYVRAAQLKGLPWSTIVLRHVLRNALIPTITVLAVSIGWLISGLIVVENVYNYPGIGRLLTFAIDRRDLPLLQAVTFIATTIYALSNFAADILAAVLNPRVRL